MKNLFASLPVLAAAIVAFCSAPAAHAQIVTFDTIVTNNGTNNVNFSGNNSALSQTFTNVAELNNLTYEFVQNGTDSIAQTINAYLVQWNPSNNRVMSTITVETTPNSSASDTTTALNTSPLFSFVVPPSSDSSWTTQTYSGGGNYPVFEQVLNINQYLDPSLTYAVVLIDTNGDSSLGLPGVDTTSNAFGNQGAPDSGVPYGTAYRNTAGTTTFTNVANMINHSGNGAIFGAPEASYGFSQIQLVPGNNIVPTPEPRTAAAILCALFVAALAGRQMLLRRQDEQAAQLALVA